MHAKKLDIGVRVRYVGGQKTYRNAVLYLLIGRTGIIRAVSQEPGQHWTVEMDEGCYDLEARSDVLVPIDDHEADGFIGKHVELEAT